MESLPMFIKRNESQPIVSIIESALAMGFPKQEILDAISEYIDGKTS